MIGQVFGRWTVISAAEPASFPTKKVSKRWMCRCACGEERAVAQLSLRNGRSSSCGCYNREMSSIKGKTHGLTDSPEYVCWQSMRQRVLNHNNHRHEAYSGRGIDICDRWSDFSLFLKDMGRRPSKLHSIDRINNDKGYEADNCRWALAGEQMVNRRCTRSVDIDGESIPLADLARQSGIPANTLRARIVDLGWPIDIALSTPVRPKAR